ncbi:hypothetical protein PENTCL1PPCAC_20959, partial [Pristionchus entomophagus]
NGICSSSSNRRCTSPVMGESDHLQKQAKEKRCMWIIAARMYSLVRWPESLLCSADARVDAALLLD